MQITNFSFLFLFLPAGAAARVSDAEASARTECRAARAEPRVLRLLRAARAVRTACAELCGVAAGAAARARLADARHRGLHCGALLFQVYRLSDRQLEPADRAERRDPDDRRAARRLVFHVPRHQLSGGRPAGHDPGGAELWLSAALFHVLPQGRAGSADAL